MFTSNVIYNLRKLKYYILLKFKPLKRELRVSLKRRQAYPRVIQLPITHLCNFDCVMCGMHHMITRKDFTADQLKLILTDRLFSKVESVGVNGGEPFLKKDLVECFEVMISTLPNLKEFNIISNGYLTNRIVEHLEKIKEICSSKKIKVNLSLSLDGVGDMQDFHRGRSKAFENINNTVTKILSDKERYVDRLNIICTITRYNIDRINEVEVWAENNRIDVAYNIATENVRIENQDRVQSFSIFSEERTRMLTEEFFYKKYLQTKSERFFAIYLFCKTNKRYDICPCMYNEWITLTPDCQIGFCATHSKNLGSGLEKSSYLIVKENLQYLEEIRTNYCENCSHYMYSLNGKGYKLFLEDQFKNNFLH